MYNHNADTYGQNIHACVNLRRILGLGQVARIFWGLTQPPKLRAAAGLPCQGGDLRTRSVGFWPQNAIKGSRTLPDLRDGA